MTFPTREDIVGTGFSSAVTGHDADLPAVVNVDDLLIVQYGSEEAVSQTGPTGFTDLYNDSFAGYFAKVADGTEDGEKATVTTNISDQGAALAHRYSGWYGSLSGVELEDTPTDTGTTTPNPDAITPSWGAADHLVVACFNAADDDATVSGYPSGFSGGTYQNSGGGVNAGATVGTAYVEDGSTTVDPGSFTLSESEFTRTATIAIRPGIGTDIICSQGSLSLSGQAVNLEWERVTAAEQGSYDLSGQAVGLLLDRVIPIGQGAYTLNGQAVSLSQGFAIGLSQGSFMLSGQAAGLLWDHRLAAPQGDFALGGQAVNLEWGHLLEAGQGAIALNGQAAAARWDRRLEAAQGGFALGGQAVNLEWGHLLEAGQGDFALNGQAAAFSQNYNLTSEQGSFVLAGQAVTLTLGEIWLPSDGGTGGWAEAGAAAGGWTDARDSDNEWS